MQKDKQDIRWAVGLLALLLLAFASFAGPAAQAAPPDSEDDLGRTPTRTSTRTPTRTPKPAFIRTATSTPTRTPTRTATMVASPSPTAGAWTPPTSLPCTLLPADNIWNRTINSLPVHARSAQYIASIGGSTMLHPGYGSRLWQGDTIGLPYIVVPAGQPLVPISFDYVEDSDPGPYPLPPDAPIQGGTNSSGDRHVLVVQAGSCALYEVFKGTPNGNGSWQARAGVRWDLTSNALRPDGWTSADAAGLPILPGLVRYDEVSAGAIRHAIRFTTEQINTAHIWPARHSDGWSTDPNVAPMGLRLRLKAGVNISGYPARVRVILQALKDYGMILSDTGGPLDIAGTPDGRWDDDEMHELEGIHASDFEAVDESGLMINVNSGQSR